MCWTNEHVVVLVVVVVTPTFTNWVVLMGYLQQSWFVENLFTIMYIIICEIYLQLADTVWIIPALEKKWDIRELKEAWEALMFF